MKNMIAASILLALSGTASAADLSFDNFAIGYEIADFDCDTQCDGFSAGFSKEINETFFVGAAGVWVEDFDVYGLSVGARHNFSDTSAVYGVVGVSSYDGDTNASIGAGVRSMVSDSFELDFGVSHVFVDGGASGAHIAGTYFFTDATGLTVNLSGGEGAFGGGLGMRVNF